MMLLKSLKNNENVLILEDDIIFKDENFIDIFHKITNDLQINWDIIFFNPDRVSKRKKKQKFLIDFNKDFYSVKKTSKYNYNYITLGSFCYLVNKKSIHKIIKHKITDDIDVLINKLGLNIYITKKNFIEPNYNLPSTR